MPRRSPEPDVAQNIARIVAQATEGEYIPAALLKKPRKNPAAVALGRLGGLKGGPARAKALSKERMSEIGREAMAKRWGK